MINKLIDYIQSKVPVMVTPSSTTNSKYLKLNNKTIRISDHFGGPKEGIDLIVIVPETPKNFIISIGFKVYCYTSLRKTGDFVVSYVLIENNTSDKYETKLQKQKKEINILLQKIKTLEILSKNLASSNKEAEYKQRCSNQTATIAQLTSKRDTQANEIYRLLKVQAGLKAELQEKDDAIKEAVDIIDTLRTNPEARELLYSPDGKKYYLDNFTKDAREMIQDIIKDYYSKTSG